LGASGSAASAIVCKRCENKSEGSGVKRSKGPSSSDQRSSFSVAYMSKVLSRASSNLPPILSRVSSLSTSKAQLSVMTRIPYTQTLAAVWLALLFSLQSLVQGHMIDVPAGKKECFFEDLHKMDKVCPSIDRLNFQLNQFNCTQDDSNVSSGRGRTPRHRLLGERSVVSSSERSRTYVPALDQLADPEDRLLGKHIKQSTGSVSITAEKDGRHEYCFSNQMSAIADKMVRYVLKHALMDFLPHVPVPLPASTCTE
jgi:hypothetical protein